MSTTPKWLVRGEEQTTPCTQSLVGDIRLWVLRCLVPLEGYRHFIKADCFADDQLADAVGLTLVDEQFGDKFNRAAVRLKLIEAYEQCDAEKISDDSSPILTQNIQRLRQLVSLSDADCDVLRFIILLNTNRALMLATYYLGDLSNAEAYRTLSIILGLPEITVQHSLGPGGMLSRSGLVVIDSNGRFSLDSKMDLISASFSESMTTNLIDPIWLIRDRVRKSAPTSLTPDDYPGLQAELSLLRSYLSETERKDNSGMNFLVYGPPGTGKTELARLVAKEVGVNLFEVARQSESGDPLKGEARLMAYRAAQSFLQKSNSILLFEEVSDIFEEDDANPFGINPTQKSKAWITQMLESNSVPTFWLTNSIAGIDSAYIRRFDMVVEVPIPPVSQRERILKRTCADFLDEETIRCISKLDALAPAVITRAASVVSLVKARSCQMPPVKAFEILIRNTLKAQGHNPGNFLAMTDNLSFYDPDFISADFDLSAAAEGLAQAGQGRLCLYGPPGTGKTAFGYWLAETMDRHLVTKRASDLISPYIGMTERNIATAFEEAEQDEAVLLIDEADSFLQDRRRAERPWEISHVNEMLTQMESYKGVFIVTTNLMDSLDQASLRRFDLKVHFDFLDRAQRGELLRRYCHKLNLGAPCENALKAIERLELLTPGDYAVVVRRSRFAPIESSVAFVEALAAEIACKEDGKKYPIGFI
ncbi:AAA family ATPase [Aestuariirhabdus sp. LZHN29]|uniref:AAA family ATPase n=1 Tax=Aestuariirhabdus sp. LZHN29 TaxID=3417462 RepID=UPI003CF58AEF